MPARLGSNGRRSCVMGAEVTMLEHPQTIAILSDRASNVKPATLRTRKTASTSSKPEATDHKPRNLGPISS